MGSSREEWRTEKIRVSRGMVVGFLDTGALQIRAKAKNVLQDWACEYMA